MRAIAILLLAIAGLAVMSACSDDASNDLIDIVAKEYSFTMEDTVEGGVVSFRAENGGTVLHEFAFGKVEEGHTEDDIKAAIENQEDPDWIEDLGGPNIMDAGKEVVLTRQLEPGQYVYLCFIPDSEETPHVLSGMIKMFTVEGDSGAELPEPDAVIEATSGAFTIPTVNGGSQVLELKNSDSAGREFTFVSFNEGEDFESVSAWFEEGLPDPAPAVFAGGMQIVPPGESVFLELDLESGRAYTVLDTSGEQPIMAEFTPE